MGRNREDRDNKDTETTEKKRCPSFVVVSFVSFVPAVSKKLFLTTNSLLLIPN